MSRPWSSVLWAIMLVACSDEPRPTAPTTPPPPLTPADSARQVLIAFYNATGGPNWLQNRNWNTASDVSTWYGVETKGGRVTQLVLAGNNLVGTLPAQLGELTLLHRLVLTENEISGRIPPALGNLSNLTMLNLRENDLEGPIPSELGALTRLDTLDLFNTGVSGAIPPSLGNLGSLRSLTVGWNQLSGPIPAELARLDNATFMNFSRNQLTGTIPPEFGDLDSIELLSVSRNNLTGTIPAELGQLATLERLYLYDNELTGEIPPALGQLSQLEVLWIDRNDLAGPIPDEFANLTALEDLRAHENRLSGAIPPFLGGFPLRILFLGDNALSGGVPAEIGEIGSLELLTLHGNRELAGLLPRSVLGLEYLRTLTFADTGLCPQVDEEFREWLQSVPNLVGRECGPGEIERLALAEFHEMTGGASWANRGAWLSDADIGDWYGVTSEGGHVVEVTLPGNSLAGPPPGGDRQSHAVEGARSLRERSVRCVSERRLGTVGVDRDASGRELRARRRAPVRSSAAGPSPRAGLRRDRPLRVPLPELSGMVQRDRRNLGCDMRQPEPGHGVARDGLPHTVGPDSVKAGAARGESGRTIEGIRYSRGTARVL